MAYGTRVVSIAAVLYFLLSSSFGQDDCGLLNIKAADRGELTSPNYNRTYSHNLYCEYTVTVSAGVLIFTVVDVDLEQGSRCSYDYLQIFDYFSDTPLTTRLCQRSNLNLPWSNETSENSLKVVFKSDGSRAGSGWKISWIVKSGTEMRCGSAPTVRNAIKTQLGSSYGDVTRYECDPGFQLTSNSIITCQIRGRWSTAPSCSRVDCGNPPVVEYATTPLFSGTFVGSMATYSCDVDHQMAGADVITCGSSGEWSDIPSCYTCGNALIVNGSGRLTSPNYPSQYPDRVDCEWIVRAPSGRLMLNLTDFAVEYGGSDCRYDYLRVVDSYEDTTIIDKKCGYDDQSPVIQCISNTATIYFHTDSSVTNRGWSLNWWWEDIACSEPLDVPNSIQTGDERQRGDVIVYECVAGYTLLGNAEVRCEMAGQWSAIPECEEAGAATDSQRQVNAASQSTTLLAIVITLAGVITISIIIGLVLVIRRRRSQKNEPSQTRRGHAASLVVDNRAYAPESDAEVSEIGAASTLKL